MPKYIIEKNNPSILTLTPNMGFFWLTSEAIKFCCCSFISSALWAILRVTSSLDSKSFVALAFDLWSVFIIESAFGKDAANCFDEDGYWILDVVDWWILAG